MKSYERLVNLILQMKILRRDSLDSKNYSSVKKKAIALFVELYATIQQKNINVSDMKPSPDAIVPTLNDIDTYSVEDQDRKYGVIIRMVNELIRRVYQKESLR